MCVSISNSFRLLTLVQHPNIVKYKGFFRTREFLYIILEYVAFTFPMFFLRSNLADSARMDPYTPFANGSESSRRT